MNDIVELTEKNEEIDNFEEIEPDLQTLFCFNAKDEHTYLHKLDPLILKQEINYFITLFHNLYVKKIYDSNLKL
jgi:hypothetical protein